MKNSPKKIDIMPKPKGWRKIVVDGIIHYWCCFPHNTTYNFDKDEYNKESDLWCRNAITHKRFSLSNWFKTSDGILSSKQSIIPSDVAQAIKWYYKTHLK